MYVQPPPKYVPAAAPPATAMAPVARRAFDQSAEPDLCEPLLDCEDSPPREAPHHDDNAAPTGASCVDIDRAVCK